MAVDQAAVRANMRHLVQHESKPTPKPVPDTAVTRGFEKVAFPKIVRELGDDNLIIRQKALLAARDLLAFPVNNVQCIAAGITPALVHLLQDPDETCRQRAAGTIECLVVKDVGARDLIQHDGVRVLVRCLCDSSEAVKEAAYRALVEAVRFDSVRRALVEQRNALPLLLAQVMAEPPGLQRLGLLVLNACTQVRHNAEAIAQLCEPGEGSKPDQRAVHALVKLLAPSHPPPIQQAAAELLGVLASSTGAKQEAVAEGAPAKLLALMAPQPSASSSSGGGAAGAAPSGVNVALATSAAGALMAITIVKEGKEAVLAAEGGLAALVGALDPSDPQLCVNAMTCITNVAEAAQARPLLAELGAAEKLNAIHASPANDVMQRSAAEALRQCRFRCWPHELLPGKELPAS